MSPRAIVQYLQKKIGWQIVGIALSILIIASASYVLYHLLHDIEPREVYAALRRTPTHALAIAPIVRRRPEEYFAANCSISVNFGGKNSNAGACPASKRAARLNAGETEGFGGSWMPNSS